ncbi:Os06g0712550 [Oryza sativa Japonica Group]|uniref:Os06g0712550 protein n=1 Tax=Oryza sativa subsp. japonica TaxID=39947 RepID=A0A0P0X0Q3_ORYSJ|nr:hypothetical protein EE612_036442 [Oryza sativa]BAS99466.1 Os06g0712550 [Oryza sativa Japonica Group]
MGCTLSQEHAMICPGDVLTCRMLGDLAAVSQASRAACFHSVKRTKCEAQYNVLLLPFFQIKHIHSIRPATSIRIEVLSNIWI